MANYELYSSTPKEFSVFWSDLYPTQTWHHLGTFEAKDQRTIQTFDLNTRNMGKFMKVGYDETTDNMQIIFCVCIDFKIVYILTGWVLWWFMVYICITFD